MAPIPVLTASLRPWLLGAALVGYVPGAFAQAVVGIDCKRPDCYRLVAPTVAANSAGEFFLPRPLEQLRELRFNGSELTPQSQAILKAPELREFIRKLEALDPNASLSVLVTVTAKADNPQVVEAQLESLRQGVKKAGFENKIYTFMRAP